MALEVERARVFEERDVLCVGDVHAEAGPERVTPDERDALDDDEASALTLTLALDGRVAVTLTVPRALPVTVALADSELQSD